MGVRKQWGGMRRAPLGEQKLCRGAERVAREINTLSVAYTIAEQ